MLRVGLSTFALALISGFAEAGALYDAAKMGDQGSVEHLISTGENVDALGPNKETPLTAATLRDDVEIAEILIDRGANVMARNTGGFTPLHAAAYAGSAKVAALLLANGAGLEDVRNVSGATPLIVAAEENRVDVAQLLIARGVNISILDRDGFSALTGAWSKNRIEMVRLLKQNGAVCQPSEVLGTEEYYRKCVEYGK
ncbi:ankyrin repeat domain-containing protein [Parasedimentitalea marina]|uniref:Ankyrin repeat domain-containing protein n=1 Tax=Parasedimentitalea marina TaxID=2483033 RepID=A0A3T0MYW5_9RHOB|nr:ankyrin repeat domain-containing protein [Parasedimentitalea marina]AZV76932.1 ankyrin repeat domain-containing protein [Parasedimentitalea marina]